MCVLLNSVYVVLLVVYLYKLLLIDFYHVFIEVNQIKEVVNKQQ